MDYSSLIRDYIDDAEGHLRVFDEALLYLEKNGLDRPLIQSTLGALHTLKGNSGMMGFESLKSFIHHVEGILKDTLEEKIPLKSALEPLFESANTIRNAIKEIEKNPSSEPDLKKEIARLTSPKDSQKSDFSLQNYLGSKTDTIRVDFRRLDELLNLVGELVIFKTRLTEIGGKIKNNLASLGNNQKTLYTELNEGLQSLGKTVTEIQEGIMKIRMLPVRVVFSKFPPMVRDIAKRQGKEVEIVFSGEDTELDKTVIDELGEPLLHIIRNAVDHGIESPDERLSIGKPPAGRLSISASQESNLVIIKVEDDGRGLDTERIKDRAIKLGLINPDASISRHEILNLIFTPGFTTSEMASDISGRGIGLDVVQKSISKLNGQITVESTLKKGTSFIIKLPLSLAIIPALMTETSGELYAIPMSAVEESIKITDRDIHIVNNKEVVRLREQILPIVKLNRFFGLREREKKKHYLVIIKKTDRKIALSVDKLRGRQEIVIKPLDDTLGKTHGIAGASILGDGKVVLIIDTNALWSGKENGGYRYE